MTSKTNMQNFGDHEWGEKIVQFLSTESPVLLDQEYAESMWAHCGSCPPCATLLSGNPFYAETLLECTRPVSLPSPASEEVMIDSAAEQITFARAVIQKLPSSFDPSLFDASLDISSRLTDEYKTHLAWIPPEATEMELLAVLGVLEASIALRSFLARENSLGGFLNNDRLLLQQREIPGTYFIDRIAKRCGISLDQARTLWQSIIAVVDEGGLGLPGVGLLAVEEGKGLYLTVMDEEPIALS